MRLRDEKRSLGTEVDSLLGEATGRELRRLRAGDDEFATDRERLAGRVAERERLDADRGEKCVYRISRRRRDACAERLGSVRQHDL